MLNGSVAQWLDSFELGETRYLPVADQGEENELIKKITSKSGRLKRTKSWKFICHVRLAISVSDATDQQLLVEVTALNDGAKSNFTI